MMKKIMVGFLLITLSISLIACGGDEEDNEGNETMSLHDINLARARVYRDLVWDHYWDEDTLHLNHFYPDTGQAAFLWPYFSTMGMNELAIRLFEDDESVMNTYHAFLDGLEYFKDVRTDGYTAYASARGVRGQGAGDVFFDDNGWVAKKFLYAYEETGEEWYLEETKAIYEYLVELGWSDLGGIFWAEGRTDWDALLRGLSATTPVVYIGAKLYDITNDAYYLEWAKKGLAFIDTLENPANHVHWNAWTSEYVDGEIIAGDIQKVYWTYNSGFVITSLVALYEITGDEDYLVRAKRTAEGAHNVFAVPYMAAGVNTYPSTAWFNALLLQGFVKLYPYDKENTAAYIDSFHESLNYGWENHRDSEGFLPPDWTASWPNENPRNLLDQTGIAEMFMWLAIHYEMREE